MGMMLVEYSVETTGENQVYNMYDEDNQVVAEGQGKENVIVINNVKLWNVLDAYLYKFKIQTKDNYVDRRISRGNRYRTVEVKGTRLYINNKPVYLKGYGKHEDSELLGRGHNSHMLKEILN